MKVSSHSAHTFLSPPISPKPGTPQESLRSSTQRPDQQVEIAKLQKRDQAVRAHEQAHISAAGGLAKSGATFSFQRGPDGKQYAIGGEVTIDTSPVSGNPEATIRKAQQIRAAALAPADPSAQDRAVAAAAAVIEAQARQSLEKERQEDSTISEIENTAPSVSPRIDLFV